MVVGRAPPRPSPISIQYDGTHTAVELRQMMPDDVDSGNASDRALQASCCSLLSVTVADNCFCL